jgi:hypothetical protein
MGGACCLHRRSSDMNIPSEVRIASCRTPCIALFVSQLNYLAVFHLWNPAEYLAQEVVPDECCSAGEICWPDITVLRASPAHRIME